MKFNHCNNKKCKVRTWSVDSFQITLISNDFHYDIILYINGKVCILLKIINETFSRFILQIKKKKFEEKMQTNYKDEACNWNKEDIIGGKKDEEEFWRLRKCEEEKHRKDIVNTEKIKNEIITEENLWIWKKTKIYVYRLTISISFAVRWIQNVLVFCCC